MTHHDKARELVERLRRQKTTDEMERHEVINADFEGAYDLLVRDCRDAAGLITAQAEENRRLREAIRQADDILEDCGFAIELGARRVLRVALISKKKDNEDEGR